MKSVLLFIIIFVSVEILAISCQSNNLSEDKEGYEFYYYPAKNVYYNPEKKNFLYSLDGGKTWDSTMNPSGTDPGTLGEKVIIRSLAEDVYKSNETHRNLYKGKLYNFTAADTAYTSAAPEVTERKVEQKTRTDAKPLPEEEKPKKGLKKFLKKLFGKHKKQEQ
jgi:hypothetical protein